MFSMNKPSGMGFKEKSDEVFQLKLWRNTSLVHKCPKYIYMEKYLNTFGELFNLREVKKNVRVKFTVDSLSTIRADVEVDKEVYICLVSLIKD